MLTTIIVGAAFVAGVIWMALEKMKESPVLVATATSTVASASAELKPVEKSAARPKKASAKKAAQ